MCPPTGCVCVSHTIVCLQSHFKGKGQKHVGQYLPWSVWTRTILAQNSLSRVIHNNPSFSLLTLWIDTHRPSQHYNTTAKSKLPLSASASRGIKFMSVPDTTTRTATYRQNIVYVCVLSQSYLWHRVNKLCSLGGGGGEWSFKTPTSHWTSFLRFYSLARPRKPAERRFGG